METVSQSPLLRIAVFYDGNYIAAVSNFYKYSHSRKVRLNIYGLHNYIKQKVAEKEKVDPAYAQIVEAHYFRGKFSTESAIRAKKLEADRRFEEVLTKAGVIQHFFPMDERGPRPEEKGIDVWLSLEAYDLAVHKRFDVLTLVACDGDYVPLVRKLNAIGTRVMLLAWDFKYSWTDEGGVPHDVETRTAQSLIEECSYPIMMTEEINSRAKKRDPIIDNLFLT